MVDLARSAIFVEDNRAVPLGVGDELPPASGDESAGDILQGAPDRIASGPQLAAIRDVQVTGARFEANIEGRDGLHGGYRPDPAPFTSCRRGPYQPAHPLEHPRMPQGRVASQVTAFADQPIGVANVLNPQQVGFAHVPGSSV